MAGFQGLPTDVCHRSFVHLSRELKTWLENSSRNSVNHCPLLPLPCLLEREALYRVIMGRSFFPCETNMSKQPGVLAQGSSPGRLHDMLHRCLGGTNGGPEELECGVI